MSILEEKEQELARFRKILVPCGLVFVVIALSNSVNFLVGSMVFPDAIRPLLLPAMILGALIYIPMSFKQRRLMKAIQALKESSPVID